MTMALWQLARDLTTRDLQPPCSLGMPAQGSLSLHSPRAWSLGHSASQAAKLMSCDGKCEPQTMDQSGSRTQR